MAELVVDCMLCVSNTITFDLLASIHTRPEYSLQYWYEVFGVSRQCHHSSLFVLEDSVEADYTVVYKITS